MQRNSLCSLKKHSLEFLRENAHLRVYQCFWRYYESALCCSTVKSKRIVYVNTPIITGSDAEGAGEMFKVTALPLTHHVQKRKSKL
jgi:asparaginyl-tRNA synthetase